MILTMCLMFVSYQDALQGLFTVEKKHDNFGYQWGKQH